MSWGGVAVSVRTSSSRGFQDFVYKIDISTPQVKLMRSYVVGNGDDKRLGGEDQPLGPAGVGSTCRVVAPMLAIEQDTRLPGSG